MLRIVTSIEEVAARQLCGILYAAIWLTNDVIFLLVAYFLGLFGRESDILNGIS